MVAVKVVKTGGDDLEDNLELDPNLLASSDIDDDDGEEYDDEGLLDDEEDGGGGDVVVGNKRKIRDDEEGLEESVDREEGEGGEGVDDLKVERKRRKKEKEKKRKLDKSERAERARTSDKSFVHLTTDELAAILLNSIRETFPSATPMEIEDVRIPQTNLAEPPNYSPIDTSDSFAPLFKRVETLLGSSSSKKKGKGSGAANGTPRVIILSMSGQRCADVVRAVRDVKRTGQVAKLFAKHFKLADQVTYLSKTNVSIAVGTPARVAKLVEQDALKITQDTIILLDASFLDSKKRTLLTLPESRTELWKSLFVLPIRSKILGQGAKVGAF
ncbi:U3-containing 90S pre-ribosomal complex subunit-domain containing protein [Naematelia encephala]|uniref:U3-containing 90S pre-ribosomal complex subunit-domain containing protein n=1 Tax=Naematelia encephala TaxID=71784 RepID=A0A1Y2AFS6_9TREE|nr:U3-containing 90S pre-ribosomal complex subunit-domain containing protein [Naematelia encephala]